MFNIPSDIVRQIALNLQPNILSLVSKQFNSIYDEYFYKVYLEQQYCDNKIWVTTTYKALYKKYLLDGYFYGKKELLTSLQMLDSGIKPNVHHIGVKGIKAYEYSFNKRLTVYIVLNFNGDLYSICDGRIILLNTQVIDLCKKYYIKNMELYECSDNGSTQLYQYPDMLTYIKVNHEMVIIGNDNSLVHYSNYII
jgi:hypothetical protein